MKLETNKVTEQPKENLEPIGHEMMDIRPSIYKT